MINQRVIAFIITFCTCLAVILLARSGDIPNYKSYSSDSFAQENEDPLKKHQIVYSSLDIQSLAKNINKNSGQDLKSAKIDTAPKPLPVKIVAIDELEILTPTKKEQKKDIVAKETVKPTTKNKKDENEDISENIAKLTGSSIIANNRLEVIENKIANDNIIPQKPNTDNLKDKISQSLSSAKIKALQNEVKELTLELNNARHISQLEDEEDKLQNHIQTIKEKELELEKIIMKEITLANKSATENKEVETREVNKEKKMQIPFIPFEDNGELVSKKENELAYITNNQETETIKIAEHKPIDLLQDPILDNISDADDILQTKKDKTEEQDVAKVKIDKDLWIPMNQDDDVIIEKEEPTQNPWKIAKSAIFEEEDDNKQFAASEELPMIINGYSKTITEEKPTTKDIKLADNSLPPTDPALLMPLENIDTPDIPNISNDINEDVNNSLVNSDVDTSGGIIDSISSLFKGDNKKENDIEFEVDETGNDSEDVGFFDGLKEKIEKTTNFAKPRILPTEVRLSFEHNKASISGKTLKWLEAFANKVKKDPTVAIEIRMDGNINTELQHKRLSLINRILYNKGVLDHQVKTVFTSRQPNTLIIRTIRLANENNNAKAYKNMYEIKPTYFQQW